MDAPDRRREIVALADQCVQCGACLPHCPTYAESGCESESPRGRIAIAKALALGRIDAADAAASIDHCLACRACEAMCPAKVDYSALLRDARARTRPQRARSAAQAWLAALQRRPTLLSVALRMAGLARRGWPRLRRWLPATTRPPSTQCHPPARPARGRLLLFEGCVARDLDGGVHRAAIRVLTALGWEVQPSGAGLCCGSLPAYAGDADTAASLAAASAARLGTLPVDAVILCNSGCFESLRQALAPLPVHELMAFLADDPAIDDLPWRAAHDARVVLHTPCTQRNVVRRPTAAADVLARLRGLQVIDTGSPACCGAAGDLRLGDHARAAAFARPHLDALDAAACAALASSNIGCRVHFELELAARGGRARTLHPIELLASHLP